MIVTLLIVWYSSFDRDSWILDLA